MDGLATCRVSSRNQVMPMIVSTRCGAFAVAVLLAAGLCPVRADEVDVKDRLDAAKVEYREQVTKYKAAVTDVLDKREEKARAKGDKKLVDQALADRKAFDAKGDPPAGVPDASKQRFAQAKPGSTSRIRKP